MTRRTPLALLALPLAVLTACGSTPPPGDVGGAEPETSPFEGVYEVTYSDPRLLGSVGLRDVVVTIDEAEEMLRLEYLAPGDEPGFESGVGIGLGDSLEISCLDGCFSIGGAGAAIIDGDELRWDPSIAQFMDDAYTDGCTGDLELPRDVAVEATTGDGGRLESFTVRLAYLVNEVYSSEDPVIDAAGPCGVAALAEVTMTATRAG